jgi:hypothetical protein
MDELFIFSHTMNTKAKIYKSLQYKELYAQLTLAISAKAGKGLPFIFLPPAKIKAKTEKEQKTA